jgi:hypothetical protein
MDITNKTSAPLAIPLPGGKTLRLGPGNTGQVMPKALEHPPVKKLIDAGQLEVADGNHKHSSGSSAAGSGGRSAFSGKTGSGGIRRAGDR